MTPKILALINTTSHRFTIQTERLELLPFTKSICEATLQGDYSWFDALQLNSSDYWPDEDILESLPRTLNTLTKIHQPTGFESWMIIEKDTRTIIGDVGFKGYQFIQNTCDLGYGIVKEKRRQGFAFEACEAIVQWALANQQLEAITAATYHDNNGSIRLLEKLQFIRIAQDEEFIYWELKK